jgi:hypothetical protein
MKMKFKFIIKFLLLTILLLSLFSVFGCTPLPVQPQLTQLQLRQIQTRSYGSRTPIDAMKAVINALQDEGFIVKNADKDLGFIQATRESDLDPGNRGGGTFFGGFGMGSRNSFGGWDNNPRWDKASIVECSGNVNVYENKTQVRLIFQRKVVDNFGDIASVEQILDPEFYQMIFAKIDKSLFLQGQKL